MKQQKVFVILGLFIFVAGGVLLLSFRLRNKQQSLLSQPSITIQKNPNYVTQYTTAPTITASLSLSSPCTETSRISSYLYLCSSYSIMLPAGWRATGSEHTEFTNYDPNIAAQRSYNLEIDRGKQKLGIIIISTTQNLDTFIDNDI